MASVRGTAHLLQSRAGDDSGSALNWEHTEVTLRSHREALAGGPGLSSACVETEQLGGEGGI
jgi:hypothetical protein